MDPATVVRVGSLCDLRRAADGRQAPLADAGAHSAVHALALDSSDGCVLLGTLRVAGVAESYAHAPFRIPAGSLVFVDRQAPGTAGHAPQADEIRCLAVEPRVSWFADGVAVLLAHWRYVPPPAPLRGPTARAWAHIEILSPPVLLPAGFAPPQFDRPLSWWAKHQMHPELELEQDFLAAIAESPPLSDASARLVLTQQLARRPRAAATASVAAETAEGPRLQSILGRVRAVSGVLQSVDGSGSAFVVEVAVGPTPPSTSLAVPVPILVSGRRHRGLLASLCLGDLLLATSLRPATLAGGEAVFATSQTSRAYRIDEFDGLDESQACMPPATQSPFTHCSRESLLTQIGLDGAAPPTMQPRISQRSAAGANGTAGAAGEDAPCTPQPAAAATGDCHLLAPDGRLESYEGEITRIVDPVLGIYVVDDAHLLMLTLWPLLSPLFILRVGSRVLLDNVHLVLLADSASYHWGWIDRIWPDSQDGTRPGTRRTLVFCACARSSIRVTSFPASCEPAGFPSIVDSSLAAVFTKRTEGLVQLIEALEAFWRLFAKFSATLSVGHGRGPVPADVVVQRIAHMALALTTSPGDVPGVSPARCDAYMAIVDHRSACNVGRPAPGGPYRVLKLRDVVQRFVSWRKAREAPLLGDDALGQRLGHVQVTSIGPSELNIEGIPLIGRLVVSSRGCIYLQDDTGQIRAFPTAAACGEQAPATQLDTASTPPAFAGQSLIGHVCVWRSWRLVVEDVSAASTVPDGGILPKERVPFSLAYVRLANPLAVYVDGSFGRSTSLQSPDERNASSPEAPAARPRRDPARHFLLFAHAQGLAMPQPGVSPDDTGAPTTDCAEAGWGALTIVKGAGLALASDSPSLEPLHGGNGCRDIETLDIGNVGKRDLRAIHVRCKFDTTPVCFASGAAYIVCVGDPVRCREFGASLGASADSLSSVILLDLEREDHVHPVRVVSQQPGLADCAALSGGVPTETGLRAVAACLPVVRLNFASEDARRQIQPPTALSVSDLVDSAAAASGADRIVSVSGTILQREVTKAVTFCAARRADTALGDAAPAVVGQLENRITLQDNQDGTRTVAVYVKLSTFSHPLGLVPGARVVFRDVVVSVSKSTGNPYLVATAASSIDEVAAAPVLASALAPTPAPHAHPGLGPAGAGATTSVCIGQIYAAPSLAGCRLAMHCYVDSVESLKLAMRCTACMRIVVDMGCACARKQHRAAGSGGGERAATMRAEAELLCLASDGSGIAWLSVSREDDVACVLGLQAAELAELCDAAAQAWNGQLLWRRQARDAEDAQASGASGIVAGAAATAAGARVLIEGAVGSGGGGGGDAPGLELPVRRQPLRMDGRGVVVNKRAPPTVVAARVSRLATAELCWRLLRGLGSH